MITVLHFPNNLFREIPSRRHRREPDAMTNFIREHKGSYKAVAEVDTDDLEYAYMQTNNINTNWCENTDVSVIDPQITEFRSTSVGDIMIRNEEMFVVANCGFDKIVL